MNVPTLVDQEAYTEVIYPLLDKVPDNGTIVELGTFLGGSMCRMADRARTFNKILTFYAIDNFLCHNISPESRKWTGVFNEFYHEFWANVEKFELQRFITPISEDSIEAANGFADNSIDMLWVDDDHSYPHTVNVLRAWLPKIKKGGVICGHDYCSGEGIRMAVQEVFGDRFKLNSTQTTYWVEL